MHQQVGPAEIFQAYLLGSFAIGLLLVAKCVVQIAFRKCHLPRWVEVISGLGALGLTFILATDAILFAEPSDQAIYLWPGLISVALGCIFLWTHFRVSTLQLARVWLLRQPVAWLAIVLTCGAIWWSSDRYCDRALRLEMERLSNIVDSGRLETISGRVAITDRGREVQLFCYVTENEEEAQTATSSGGALDSLSGWWGDSSSQSNCHGWVFTGGKHLLWRDGVEMILEDNGYEICDTPKTGDLIIYRGPNGDPVHTGTVHFVYWDGTVMIKSKWGLRGRFVHRPEEQPYSKTYSFYRSPRSGHLVTIRGTRIPSVAGSARKESQLPRAG